MSAVSLAGESSAPSRALTQLRVTGPAGVASAIVIAVATFAALFGPLLALYDPNVPNLPLAWAGPVGGHLLGYDFEGRDVLSRLLAGAQSSMLGPLAVVDEVLRLHYRWPADRRRARVAELLDLVGLDSRQSRALPRFLSGGQRQRVAIARALAAGPVILILDESVAALDVSIQAQVLNLFADIRDESRVSYVLISHDLAVVRQLTDETIVLRRGTVVERGPTARVLDNPGHPYTQRLRSSVPRPGWKPSRHPLPTVASARSPSAAPGKRDDGGSS